MEEVKRFNAEGAERSRSEIARLKAAATEATASKPARRRRYFYWELRNRK
jgi:hypothetical protein